MSLEIILSIIAIGITVIFYFADKIINGSTRAAKRYMLLKWTETKDKSLKLQHTIIKYCSLNNRYWNSIALTDSPVTYKDLYNTLVEKYELEYSNSQFKALKKKNLSKFQIEEFTTKIKIQEDNLNFIQHALDLQIKKLSAF